MFVAVCLYLPFIMSQLLLSRTELSKCTPSILMYSCDHIIFPGLSILFLYAPAHKAWIFEKFVFELEAFSWDFKTGCILFWQLMSLNKKTVMSSGKSHIFISWSSTCTFTILVSASKKIAIIIVALIYNNIESGHPPMNSDHKSKGIRWGNIYFNFRLDIGITNFRELDEFAPVTKHERQRK